MYLLFISIVELARNDGIEIFIFDKPHVSGCYGNEIGTRLAIVIYLTISLSNFINEIIFWNSNFTLTYLFKFGNIICLINNDVQLNLFENYFSWKFVKIID